MVRKTITINDDLFHNLELNQMLDQYQSFSELVSNALYLLVEKQKNEHYKQAMIDASEDKMYIKDMKRVEDDFQYSDLESVI